MRVGLVWPCTRNYTIDRPLYTYPHYSKNCILQYWFGLEDFIESQTLKITEI